MVVGTAGGPEKLGIINVMFLKVCNVMHLRCGCCGDRHFLCLSCSFHVYCKDNNRELIDGH